MKPRPLSANNIPISNMASASALDNTTIAESVEQQKLRKRADVTINVMEQKCRNAMQSNDDDEKIKQFTEAKSFSKKILEILEALPKTGHTIQQLEKQTQNRAQIALELTSAFLRKMNATSNIDSKIEYSLLAEEEIKITLAALEALPTSKIPHGIVNERKILKTQIKIDLMNLYVESARSTKNTEQKKKLFTTALSENRSIQDELKQLPDSRKDKKTLTNDYSWNEWVIQRELESVLYGELKATTDDVIQAMQKLAFAKKHANIPNELDKEFQYKVELFSIKNDASNSLSQDLHQKCKYLQADKNLFASTTNLNRKLCSEAKEATRTKLALRAVMDSQFKAALAFLLLERLREKSPSDINNFALKWVAVNDKKMSLLIGVFDNVVNPMPKIKAVAPSDPKKCEILSSLIEQLTEIEGEAKWMADLFQNKQMPEQDIEQFIAVARCSKQFNDAAQFELELTQTTIDVEKKSSSVKQTAQSTNLHQNKSNKIIPSDIDALKTTNEIASINIKEDSETQIINTRFDGKLIGRREGNFVVIEDIKKESVKYRQDGELWVRHEKEDDAVDANILELEQELKEERRQEKSLQKIFKKLDKAENTVAEKRERAQEYIRLSDFSEKNGAPFSQSIGVFKLALHYQEQAMSVLNRFISKLEAQTFPNEELDERLNELKLQLQALKDVNNETRGTKISAIKTQRPNGPALNFLFDENQVTRITKTLDKRKLKGAEVSNRGLIPDDFMDEHEIHIHELAQPLVLHTHYRNQNAEIEEKTASHLKYQDTNGVDTRSPVLLNVLKKVYAFQTANADNENL